MNLCRRKSRLAATGVLICFVVINGCAVKKTSPMESKPSLDNQAIMSGENFIAHWQTIGPFLSAPLEGSIDHLLKYGGESQIIPSSDQILNSEIADNGVAQWQPLLATSSTTKFSYPPKTWEIYQQSQGLSGIANFVYASSDLILEKPAVLLIGVKGVRQIYVNGVMYWGQPYAYDWYHIPIPFAAGKNRILLKIPNYGDPEFTFHYQLAPAAITIGDDFTIPDLVKTNESQKVWLGIPVVNNAEAWARSLTLQISNGGIVLYQQPIAFDLAPLSTNKMAAQVSLALPEPFAASSSFRIAILSREGSVKAERSVTLNHRAPSEPSLKTFLSDVDQSVQAYGVVPPLSDAKLVDATSSKAKFGAILSLHGANVTAETQIHTYSPKSDLFIIAPTNRRPHGFAYQDLGRLDVLEALKDATQLFSIDRHKIYLFGHSMGGQGAWHLGTHYPDRFLGLAPAAGWSSFDAYIPPSLQRALTTTSPDLLALRQRSNLDSNHPYFLSNLGDLPIFITQSKGDSNVPALHSRRFLRMAEELKLPVQIREVTSDEHWCREPLVEGVGFNCVDHPAQLEFLKAHSPQQAPSHLDIRVNDLSINASFYWLRIAAQEKVMTPSVVHAEWKNGNITITSSNVTRVVIDTHRLPQLLDKTSLNSLKISWNGKVAGSTPLSDHEFAFGNVKISEKFKNNFSRYGLIKSIFNRPALAVVGTQGTPAENEDLLRLASLLANRVWATANARLPIIKDSELTAELKNQYNLILLGNEKRNQVSAILLKSLPFYKDAKLTRLLKSPDASLMSIWKSPWQNNGLILFVTGHSSAQELAAAQFLPMVERQGSTNVDFLILSPKLFSLGWGGLKAAGYFSNDWDLHNHDYVIEP